MPEQGWIEGPQVSEISETKPLAGRIAGTDVLFVRVGAEVRCLEDSCPHQNLPMADADIEPNHTIICPWHSMVFDCLTGECVSSPGEALTIFPTRIEDGRVLVKK